MLRHIIRQVKTGHAAPYYEPYRKLIRVEFWCWLSGLAYDRAVHAMNLPNNDKPFTCPAFKIGFGLGPSLLD
jgi:hypothetical protein